MNAKSTGFTLIELLVVMAVIGILAGGILVAINPVEQIAKAQDTNRKSTLAQLAHAMENYGVTNSSNYQPMINYMTTWMQPLIDSGELKSIPPTAPDPQCIGGSGSAHTHNNYCMDHGTPDDVIVYVRLASQTEKNKCPPATPNPYYSWHSTTGKICTICDGGYVWGFRDICY